MTTAWQTPVTNMGYALVIQAQAKLQFIVIVIVVNLSSKPIRCILRWFFLNGPKYNKIENISKTVMKFPKKMGDDDIT